MENKIIVNDTLIGIAHGKYLGYFNSKTPNSPFSNFYCIPHGFKVYFGDINGKQAKLSPVPIKTAHVGTFQSVEQFFAFGKAMTMHDQASANKIYATNSKTGKEFKHLGRSVRNYDDKLWKEVASEWMLVGMQAKFLQDQFSYNALSSTSEYQLVEANPYDKVWGAGVSIDQAFESADGQNKQGHLLMKARKMILQRHPNF